MTNRLSNVVGENLRRIRRAHAVSLEQLANTSRVSRAMLGQIETGKSAPTINVLGRIAVALKVPLAALITEPAAETPAILWREKLVGSAHSVAHLVTAGVDDFIGWPNDDKPRGAS